MRERIVPMRHERQTLSHRPYVHSALEQEPQQRNHREHADPEQAELRDADHGGLYAIQMVGMVMIQDGHGRLLIFP